MEVLLVFFHKCVLRVIEMGKKC